jgi:hypothetical protein
MNLSDGEMADFLDAMASLEDNVRSIERLTLQNIAFSHPRQIVMVISRFISLRRLELEEFTCPSAPIALDLLTIPIPEADAAEVEVLTAEPSLPPLSLSIWVFPSLGTGFDQLICSLLTHTVGEKPHNEAHRPIQCGVLLLRIVWVIPPVDWPFR